MDSDDEIREFKEREKYEHVTRLGQLNLAQVTLAMQYASAHVAVQAEFDRFKERMAEIQSMKGYFEETSHFTQDMLDRVKAITSNGAPIFTTVNGRSYDLCWFDELASRDRTPLAQVEPRNYEICSNPTRQKAQWKIESRNKFYKRK